MKFITVLEPGRSRHTGFITVLEPGDSRTRMP
jgi:hypothetical protein